MCVLLPVLWSPCHHSTDTRQTPGPLARFSYFFLCCFLSSCPLSLNSKKLPVYWPYGSPPGETWQEPPAEATAATAASPQREQLAQQAPSRPHAEGQGGGSLRHKAMRGGVGRDGAGREMQVLEKDVVQATASEKRAVEQDAGLRRQVEDFL